MLEFALKHEIVTMIIIIFVLWIFYDINAIWANTLKAKYLSQANNKKIIVVRKKSIILYIDNLKENCL